MRSIGNALNYLIDQVDLHCNSTDCDFNHALTWARLGVLHDIRHRTRRNGARLASSARPGLIRPNVHHARPGAHAGVKRRVGAVRVRAEIRVLLLLLLLSL